ncbi:NAD(P)/FAD-dependent oxidoreductase [Kitasatospora kifunensis]|uniref:Glycine/D-amino acid oxidase-like deaminating enzyme n=1 Tax=Kitasatospora kifunensis TaxID=58351 RepID=A0A7W7VYI7_KITKI|nr:FAD-dependent oxidoreductase [Kitasatospora kifunensis]MBB4927571.1 glycine/D-amino acid oxidase-like deaminating enzyme [Kitasatospora kifunensis]
MTRLTGPRVAVIGAGLLGASTAFHLARRGARVEIVERSAPASGTSGASFARISALHKLPRAYFELNHAGLRAWHDFARSMPALPGLNPGLHLSGPNPPGLYLCGSHVCGDTGDFAEHLRTIEAWGATVRPPSTGQLGPEVGGPVRLGADTLVAQLPEEGWVDVPVMVDALLTAARRDGAVLHLGREIVGMDVTASGPLITLADGGQLAVEAVVNAAGPRSDTVARLVGRRLPLAPSRGLLVDLDITGCPVRPAMVETPQATVRPAGPARVQARADAIDAELNSSDGELAPDAVASWARQVARVVGQVLPSLSRATVVGHRVGIRSMPADGYPSVGAVRDLPGYYEVVSHSGVTLGALLGHLLAEELLTGTRDPLLTPYTPDRFTSAGVRPIVN